VNLADPPGFDGMPDSGETFVFLDGRLDARGAGHDADGNVTHVDLDVDADGPGVPVGLDLAYDLLNQLESIDDDDPDTDPDVEYRYDADGFRVEAVRGTSVRRYLYDTTAATPRLLAEYDGSGALIASYVHGLGLIERHTGEVGSLVYHYDSRGSTLALTGVNGSIEAQYRYSPYGAVVDHEGDLSGALGTGDFVERNPFTYNGRDGVFDDGNGLYFMRTRYYAPDLMRFIQKDKAFSGSLEDPQSLNRYSFVRGDPISRVDPNGEWFLQMLSVALSVGFECLDGDGCTLQEAAGAALEGFISSFGGGVGSSMLLGALGSVAGELVKGNTDLGELAKNGLGGAAFGGLGSGVGKGAKSAAKGSKVAQEKGATAAWKVMARNSAKKAPKNVSKELRQAALEGTGKQARDRAINGLAESVGKTAAIVAAPTLSAAAGTAADAIDAGGELNACPTEPAFARPGPPVSYTTPTTAPSGPPSPCH
jgi:RHS repeat-associated protein